VCAQLVSSDALWLLNTALGFSGGLQTTVEASCPFSSVVRSRIFPSCILVIAQKIVLEEIRCGLCFMLVGYVQVQVCE